MRFPHLAEALTNLPAGRIGVAVSGGGDSVALLVLMHESGRQVEAVTVDHGLRAASAAEAASVGTLCDRLGVSHTVMHWQHGEITGNLQDAAREARRMLITEWAQSKRLEHVALGHTADDQAETVLMRLARGSGVDGLAGIAPVYLLGGVTWHRPLLGVSRVDLRDYLRDRGITWVEDPSNDDLRFDRVKMRKVLALLAPLGIDTNRLNSTATHMQRARRALESSTLDLAQTCVELAQTGDIRINLAKFSAAPEEICLRLLAAALGWVSSARYRPRFASLNAVLDMTAKDGGHRTLHGCTLHAKNGSLTIGREPAATSAQPLGVLWDNRWLISGPEQGGETVRALDDDGLAQCPDWRQTGLKRKALLATPSVWRHDELIAAPLANRPNGWETTLAGGTKAFIDSLITLKA